MQGMRLPQKGAPCSCCCCDGGRKRSSSVGRTRTIHRHVTEGCANARSPQQNLGALAIVEVLLRKVDASSLSNIEWEMHACKERESWAVFAGTADASLET